MILLKPTEENIKLAAKAIRNGGIVAFPTETVYGLGADALNPLSVSKIFEVKERPEFDPLIVHIYNFNQLELIAKSIPKKLSILIENLWPGPLTIVVEKTSIVPEIVTSGLRTVAIRMPENQIALKLIKYSNTPIAAPSANKFTRVSPTRVEHILKQFKDEEINYIIDGGKTNFGIESTIVKYIDNKFYILRKGSISKEEIEDIIKEKVLYYKQEDIEAPGNFKKHYAPKAKLKIVDENMKIKDDPEAGYIAFCKPPISKFKVVKILSPTKNLREAAANLFEYFHQMEDMKIKKIYVEKIEEKGIGEAIMDRIRKASGK